MKPIYLYGYGGHSRVILDILQQQCYPVAGFVADKLPTDSTTIDNLPIYLSHSLLAELNPDHCQWVVAIGNNTIRQKITKTLEALGHHFATVIHPSAQVGSRVTVSPGTVIMANTVINCDTHLGRHVIVNTGVTIDHDCTIEDFCHIAPGSTLCGHVTVGEGSWLKVGTNVSPCQTLAAKTISSPGSIFS